MLLTTGNNNKIIQLTVALKKKKKSKWLLALIHQSMMPSKARLYPLHDHPQHWLLVLTLDLPKVGRRERHGASYQERKAVSEILMKLMLVTHWGWKWNTQTFLVERKARKGDFLTSRVEERKSEGDCEWFWVNQPTGSATLTKWQVKCVTQIQKRNSAIHRKGSKFLLYVLAVFSVSPLSWYNTILMFHVIR